MREAPAFAHRGAALTLEDTATYLLGPVLRFVLGLRGVVSLHACAIEIDGRAERTAGPAGAGKSTTAAAFARRGAAVLSDDVVALTVCARGFAVPPGYPFLRLWPDVQDTLCDPGVELPLLTPNWDKRYLALAGGAFAQAPAPLAAIYLFGDAPAGDAAPRIAPLSQRDALLGLIANGRSPYKLPRAFVVHEHATLASVARTVPIRRLLPHVSIDRLDSLCDLIEADVHAHGGRPAAPAFAGASR